MKKVMVFLNKKLSFLTETEHFKVISSILIYLNPLGMIPQVVTVLTTDNITGISPVMWSFFAAIQLAFALDGIRTKNSTVFLSMFISFLESLIILVVFFMKT